MLGEVRISSALSEYAINPTFLERSMKVKLHRLTVVRSGERPRRQYPPGALYRAGADGHPEAPDRQPLGTCPYRRQCTECSPSKFIDGPFQTVTAPSVEVSSSPCIISPHRLHPANVVPMSLNLTNEAVMRRSPLSNLANDTRATNRIGR